MDLILVMRERLRDQSAEVRALSRSFSMLAIGGCVALLAAFLFSPPLKVAASGWSATSAFSMSSSASSSLSDVSLSSLTVVPPSARAATGGGGGGVTSTGGGSGHRQAAGASTTSLAASASSGGGTSIGSSSSSGGASSDSGGGGSTIATAAEYFIFFTLMVVGDGCLWQGIQLLMSSRFIAVYSSAQGSTRPPSMFSVTRFVGCRDDGGALSYRSGGGFGTPYRPTGPAGWGGIIGGTATSYAPGTLIPISLLHFPILFTTLGFVAQAAAMYLWPWWALLPALVGQVTIFFMRSRVLWFVISQAL